MQTNIATRHWLFDCSQEVARTPPASDTSTTPVTYADPAPHFTPGPPSTYHYLQDSILLLLLSAPGWSTSREFALGFPFRSKLMLLSLEPTAATWCTKLDHTYSEAGESLGQSCVGTLMASMSWDVSGLYIYSADNISNSNTCIQIWSSFLWALQHQ